MIFFFFFFFLLFLCFSPAFTNFATTVKRGQIAVFIVGILIFFDDYANALITVNIFFLICSPSFFPFFKLFLTPFFDPQKRDLPCDQLAIVYWLAEKNLVSLLILVLRQFRALLLFQVGLVSILHLFSQRKSCTNSPFTLLI